MRKRSTFKGKSQILTSCIKKKGGVNMKKLLIVLMALTLTVGFATISYAGIDGSKHDFVGKSWNTTGEICIVCHTPHNADTSVVGSPLWNHEVTATDPFTIYASVTLDALDVGQPDGASKLCLSCHDGTVGLGNFGNTTGNVDYVSGGKNLTTDLSDDHPISFVYSDALATLDGGLYFPTTDTTSIGGTIDADLLFGGKMECGSCHDVHDTAGINKLLRIANDNSAFCLTCHNK